jgi:hypothetical protein
MPRNRKTGEVVSWSEFFSQWKKGMEGITPLQQTVSVQFGQFVSMVGIIWGFIFSLIIKQWWLAVILLGGAIVLGVQILGNWQKKQILKQMDKLIKQADEQEVKENG